MKCRYDIHTVVMSLTYIMLAVCSMAFAVACSDDGALPDVSTEEHEARMSLYISLESTPAATTRSTPEGSYDDGRNTPYENYIGADNYRVLLFDTGNKYITTLIPESLSPVEADGTTSKLYVLTGRLTAPLPSSFKVMMLANWPAYPAPASLVPGVSTVDDVCTAPEGFYQYKDAFMPSAQTPIPMFGIKRFDGKTFTPGFSTYLGTIHLLRAMAKIEVRCDQKWWNIESVMLSHHATGGYCAPAGVDDEGDYVKNDYNLDYTAGIHIAEPQVAGGPVGFRPQTDGSFVIYVPEYRNTADGNAKAGDAAEITVTFREIEGKTYKIDFRDYNTDTSGVPPSEDKEFDIRRNCYYRFAITKADENAEPKISLDVTPYHVVKLDPIFGRDDK